MIFSSSVFDFARNSLQDMLSIYRTCKLSDLKSKLVIVPITVDKCIVKGERKNVFKWKAIASY